MGIKALTTRASRSTDTILIRLLLAIALHGALLAAGAGGFALANAGVGAAATGCWFDHFECGVDAWCLDLVVDEGGDWVEFQVLLLKDGRSSRLFESVYRRKTGWWLNSSLCRLRNEES
jgi:hypothetical protein